MPKRPGGAMPKGTYPGTWSERMLSATLRSATQEVRVRGSAPRRSMPGSSTNLPTGAERRVYPRFQAPVMVRYGAAAASTTGYAYDISEGGIGFAGDEAQPIGSELRLRFKWDSPMGEWYDARAVVRHTDGNKMGVQFLDLKES